MLLKLVHSEQGSLFRVMNLLPGWLDMLRQALKMYREHVSEILLLMHRILVQRRLRDIKRYFRWYTAEYILQTAQNILTLGMLLKSSSLTMRRFSMSLRRVLL